VSAGTSTHIGHLLVPAAFLVLALTGTAAAQHRPVLLGRGMAAAVALTAAVPGVAHAAATPEHLAESRLLGAFFLFTSVGQLCGALLLGLRPSRGLLAAAVGGNLAVLLLWVTTRTVGLPVGPTAGQVEGVGILDGLASTAEVVTVVLSVLLLSAGRRVGGSAKKTGGAASGPDQSPPRGATH